MIADVVEVVVITVVDVTNFLTASHASIEAFKTANLLKSLAINAMIMGERGTGKLTLARYILPHAPIIDATHFDELLDALEHHKEIIIHHLDTIANFKRLEEVAKRTGARIVATGGFRFGSEQLEELFSIRLHLPPLSERYEDVALLVDVFTKEAMETLGKQELVLDAKFIPDIGENSLSLRRQIYLYALLGGINERDVMGIMERFLEERMGGGNDYHSFLPLYEVPLIRAGLKKFKSQLQLADKLGLNRNTLRKKIAEHSDYEFDIKDEK
jgi:DNA-binding NtrC family response regulator